MPSQKTFRMELNSVERINFVGQTHYDILFRAGGHNQIVQGFRSRPGRKRVVSGRGERAWEAGEYSVIAVINIAGLSMHGHFGADRFAAERLVDALHAHAYAEDGNPGKKTPDDGR